MLPTLALVSFLALKCVLAEDLYLLVGGKTSFRQSLVFYGEKKAFLSEFDDQLDPWPLTNPVGFAQNDTLYLSTGYSVSGKGLFDKTLSRSMTSDDKTWKQENFAGLELKELASVNVIKNVAWITGGTGNGKSTQIFQNGQFTKGPDLPMSLQGHCTIQLPNMDTILAIGGKHDILEEYQGYSSYVWAMEFQNNFESDFTLLNSLNQPRTRHSCGVLRTGTGNENMVVVAGGIDASGSLKSVETLKYTEANIFNKWNLLEEQLPWPVHGAGSLMMMTSQDCSKLYMYGGRSTMPNNTTIFNKLLVFDGTTWSEGRLSKELPGKADYAVIDMKAGQARPCFKA